MERWQIGGGRMITILLLLGVFLPLLPLWFLEGWVQCVMITLSLWLVIGDIFIVVILSFAEVNGVRPVWRDWWAILWCIILWPYTIKVWIEKQ